MALHLKRCSCLSCLAYFQGAIGLARHDEISIDFAFEERRFVRAVGIGARPIGVTLED
jgi:hypothetical protein